MKRSSKDPEASLYRVGWLRLNMAAAYALGQKPIDAAYFERPPAERELLRVLLVWDRQLGHLTLRGGEGPFTLNVYCRRAKVEHGKTIQPLFMILIPAKFLRVSKGLGVPSTRRFTLVKVAERTLVLDRQGGAVKVANQRLRGPCGPYRRNPRSIS